MIPETEKTIFFNALDIETPGERAEYVERACHGDVDLLAAVRALLRENDRNVNVVLSVYPRKTHAHIPQTPRPIFYASYTTGLQTADCLWGIPTGVMAVPDVSCVTSFSSDVIKSNRALAKSLQANVAVSGGGWGVKFSASVGYQKSSNMMRSGESLFIVSKANCDYYYMKLLDDAKPDFDPTFKQWIVKLSGSQDDNDYLRFAISL